MKRALNAYPESVRNSIRTVAERLGTDYETAYFSILLESVLSDLPPSDPEIIDLILPDGS